MKITIKNPLLEKLLEEKGLNTREVWQGIRENDGSVQHLSEITDKEKEIFKTFAEIDQKVIIEQAAERQKYIDQGQSLNLMIDPSIPAKEVNALYLHAWKRGIKTFYYQHSMNAAQQFGRKKLKEVNLKQKEVDQDEPKNVCISCEA
jgi:ribonucleoside-diphosphate reductase alpha chain